MRRALLSLLIGAALLAGIPAQAFWNSRDSNYNVAISSGATYTGPIDIVASPTAWYGLRAGSGAIAAAGTQKLVNVRRASDNVACDFLVASNGGFGVTTATCNSSTQGGITPAAFAGTDASCTGSMVGTTTLTISACSSGTLNVNDPISGAGITQPAYITAIGTCASPPGTCTVNVAQTFASEAVIAQVAMFVTELYDQTGNNYHLTQSTAANQPQLLPSFSNGMPVILSTVGPAQILSNTSFVATAQPFSMSAVGEMSGSAAGGAGMVSVSTAALTQMGWYTSSTLFGMKVSNSGFQAGSGLAGVLVSAQGVFNGASSVYSVNNVETTGTVGAGSTSTEIDMAVSNVSVKYTCEGGLWPVAFNLTQRGNLYANEHTYWGTP